MRDGRSWRVHHRRKSGISANAPEMMLTCAWRSLMEKYRLSERHACELDRLNRRACRYEPKPDRNVQLASQADRTRTASTTIWIPGVWECFWRRAGCSSAAITIKDNAPGLQQSIVLTGSAIGTAVSAVPLGHWRGDGEWEYGEFDRSGSVDRCPGGVEQRSVGDGSDVCSGGSRADNLASVQHHHVGCIASRDGHDYGDLRRSEQDGHVSIVANPLVISSLTLSPTSVTGGLSATGNKVTLNGVAPTGGAVVTPTTDSALATLPVSITVAAGSLTPTLFTIATTVSKPATVTVTATYNGVSRSAVLTVIPAVHSISGHVTIAGAALPGTSISLTRTQTGSAMTDASGAYAFAGLPANGSYTLTAAANYIFVPATQSIASLAASQVLDFAAAANLAKGMAHNRSSGIQEQQ